MIKGLGTILILFGAILLGTGPVFRSRQRINLLQDWINVLHYIRAELHSNYTAIPVLLGELAENHTLVLSKGCRQAELLIQQNGAAVLESAWNYVVLENKALLHRQEINALVGLGRILGNYMIDDQLSALDRVITSLEDVVQSELVKHKMQTKVTVGTAAAMGTILVIVFL